MIELRKEVVLIKTKKKPLKIIMIILALILALVICWSGLMFWYYPHYKNNKTEIKINEISNKNEILIMSYNLRCLNPMDLGKKTWFYRADLVIKSIEREQPGIMCFQ